MIHNLKTLFLMSCLFFPPATSHGGFITPPVWDATKTTFIDGKLTYHHFNSKIAPGVKPTYKYSKHLLIGSYKDFRDTIFKFPDTCKTIYKTGIIENYFEYRTLFINNWHYSKLAGIDFANAKNAYVTEGNWGLLQTVYYYAKGSSRVVWALGILNSGEAVYKIGEAVGQTVYYLLKYPVGGVLKGSAAPVVLIGGNVWSTMASCVTTGWSLPLTMTIDAFLLTGDALWPD